MELAERTVLLADGRRCRTTHWSSPPVSGPAPAGTATGAHVLRTLEDALALKDTARPRPRLVVVGAGFIGAEAAAVPAAWAST